MGVRNGSATAENGSSANGRTQQQPPAPASIGARAAAAAAGATASASSRPAVVRDVDTAPKTQPKVERTRPPRTTPQPQAPPPHPTVRILEMDEPSGLPWTKILAFTVPALLLLGVAFFFFLRPDGRVRSGASSEDAKEVSRRPGHYERHDRHQRACYID